MDDYISREAARDLMYHKQDALTEYDLNSIPAADVEPVRHGEWGRIDDDWDSLSTFQCSVCGEEWCFEIDEDLPSLNYNYCPNCGAKMDLEEAR